MSAWLVILAVAVYMAALFNVAWRGDRDAAARTDVRRRAVTYALSLAVYCTSWTYFGAVGTAARSGWEYVTIYLGPLLAVTVMFPLWRRVAAAAKRGNVGSIADFVAARYGKSRLLGGLAALVAVAGSLPYIALQLKSLATGWAVMTQGGADGAPAEGTVLAIAIGLAGFAILFGARRADLTEHNRGLVQAIAFESIVKLAALLAAALLAVVLIAGAGRPLDDALGPLGEPPTLDARFLVMTLLSAAAVFCLPRQFHMGFVELADLDDAREARRTFTLYLILTSVAVVPIVAAGALLPSGYTNPDLFVLGLPLEFGAAPLTLFVFLGGFSAATAMVIVETVALSAMVSNELILPLAAKRRWREGARADFARMILFVRRLAIVGVLLLAWLYFRAMDRSEALASIGLTAFAALAQLAPVLVGAVLWKRGTAAGALAGLATGFAAWIYSIALPQLGFIEPPGWMGRGDPLVVGVFWSLALNVGLFIGVSLLTRPRLVERIQAAVFVEDAEPLAEGPSHPLGGAVGDLRDLMARFMGEAAARRSFADLSRELGRPLRDHEPVTPALARAIERRLAGAVGATSARGVIAAALSGAARGPDDVTRLLDEAAQAVQFNRELLQATLDNMSQAVSVVDADLRLIAWNAAYLKLFHFPSGFIHVGKPIAEVIRWNAERGECGPGGIDVHVERRLLHLKRRTRHTFERLRPDGRIIRSAGAPMPGGGYVTTYTDITEDKQRQASLEQAARDLEEANERLEARVAERTRALAEATARAEAATASKSRFLAAASHDLLQPLHAARLFVAALGEEVRPGDSETRALARDADLAIATADRLLRALLNLSKLEAGGVKPELRPVSVAALLRELEREFAPMAAEKGLRLAVRPSTAWVRSDPDLLRSLLQNLVSNAIRYTERGGVLVAARRRGADLRFDVWDTGRGIPDHSRDAIFREFHRVGGEAEPGMGLGLAIVDRVAKLLGHPVAVRSVLKRGSMFSVSTPACPPAQTPAAAPRPRGGALTGLRVLCVDNEPAILDSLRALLRRWGAEVDTAVAAAAVAEGAGPWDAALIDYHLGSADDGLAVIARLGDRLGRTALVTAESDATVLERARRLGVTVIGKPVQPAALKAFLSRARHAAAAE
ncbi:PAS-domain containing protein [Phenylobacterium sp.]|uniref:hybrid sensor histidine kinase/response regulator n=1 Tax=Phenylobacterium sp. TaxID=1871053 RepID=UPI0035B35AF9